MAMQDLTTVSGRSTYARLFMPDRRGNIHGKLEKIQKDIQCFCESLEWKCYAEDYAVASSKVRFTCENGHEFTQHRTELLRGHWCSQCSGYVKTLKDLQNIAAVKGGCCLSVSYNGVKDKYLWQCNIGHAWKSSLDSVLNIGTWCPICGEQQRRKKKRRYTIKDMQQLAEKHGGKCLSELFENIAHRLLWQCSCGHVWEATASDIQRGKWCLPCSLKIRGEKRRKYTILDMQRIAENKGGKCLSSVYAHVHDMLKWECSSLHQWEAKAANVMYLERWCPECNIGRGEHICRAFFEQLFNLPFIKYRPNWLRTVNGHQMELDGYAESISIAFEHQGRQHYEYNSYFHGTEERFESYKERDEQKRDLCKEHGIILIEIPSILELIGVNFVKSFIRNSLLKRNITLPKDFDEKTVNLSGIYISGGA